MADDVLCKLCDQVGEIRILDVVGKDVQYIDMIPHLDSCPIKLRQEKAGKPQPAHLKKRRWVGQERRAARVVGGRTTPASGALGEDGDIRSFHGTRIECKQTESPVWSLDQRTWSKLVSGARKAGETPILQVEIRDRPRPWRVYVLPKGSIDIEAVEYRQPRVRSRLKLDRSLAHRIPFYVETLSPPALVVTESELLAALRASGGSDESE